MAYPIKRNLDGIYFRVKRDDKWSSICFTDLSYEEQIEVIEKYDKKSTINMIDFLTNTLHEICENVLTEEETKDVLLSLAVCIRVQCSHFGIVGGHHE